MDGAPQTDAKPAEASSTPAPQPTSVSTPPAEQAGSETAVYKSQSIPYSRFQEVVHQKNEYATKLEELERRLNSHETNLVQTRGSSVVNDAISKLVAGGLDQNAAKLLVEAQMSIMDHRMSEKIGPLEQKATQYEVDNWVRDFSHKHEDYRSVEPLMEQEFAKLPSEYQRMISGNPAGLEMLYWKVKGSQSVAQSGQAKTNGATEAYNTMAQKTAMSGTPGRPVNSTAITRETIAAMSPEEFSRRRNEIAEAYNSGKIA
jgi:hypothetical protein